MGDKMDKIQFDALLAELRGIKAATLASGLAATRGVKTPEEMRELFTACFWELYPDPKSGAYQRYQENKKQR